MKDKKKFYIDGKWVDPKKKNDFNVINPSTEESCAVISLGSVEDINIAVNAAKKRFTCYRSFNRGKLCCYFSRKSRRY